MQTYIKGIFQKAIYISDNGYTIGNILIKETNDDELDENVGKIMTFTGFFDELRENEIYIMYGEIVNHPKYGIQYKVENYEKMKPEGIDGVKEFLCSDLFNGIGEKLATSIVNILGEDALNKIIEDKNCLSLIPKLSIKKANVIYETLVKYEESHKTIVYLTTLGFTMRDALIIYNIYKNETIMMIEHNIYDILEKTDEISFLKVDEITLKEKNYDEINRVKACIIYIMKNLLFKNGDTYLIYDEIKSATLDYLGYEIDDELFNDYLNELKFEGKIYIENDNYYTIDIYKAELVILNKIKRILSKDIIKNKNIDKIIEEIECDNNITYNDKQKIAIKKALENRITIITGGPGTGKTTIVKAITECYIRLNKLKPDEYQDYIALLSPTGRASKRLMDATQISSYTIHRFLKWNKDGNQFAINEYNKSSVKLVIVDETSMIDINLLSNLFKGLLDNIQIIFVGDYNQLPSVGPGQILKDFIESKILETIELDVLYRQNSNSFIPTLAYNIRNNIEHNFLETHDDYTFLKCNQDGIKKNLCNLCNQIIEKGYGFKVQIMAPTYLGLNGIDSLNKELQVVFNPKSDNKNEYAYGDVIYREGDKVLQLVNSPDDNVFNGDIGVIDKIVLANISESKKTEIYIDFEGNIVKYLPKDLVKIKHGYVISIHKSQGSEFDIVIIPICMSYNRMLYKKLLYTGITRAKKKLIIIGEPGAYLKGIQNNYEYMRKSNLKEKIMHIFD